MVKSYMHVTNCFYSLIGLASTTVPMYIAESAPSHLRGRFVTLNNVFICGGQLIAGLVDGAFSYDKINGWRLYKQSGIINIYIFTFPVF